jgi:hypothetical protein
MPGREDILARAMESIRPQVDVLALYWGGDGDTIPSDVYGFVDWAYPDSRDCYGSAGKMHWLSDDFAPWYLTFDDDLVYPRDFVERMTDALQAAHGRAIVSTHGRVLHEPHYMTARTVHRTLHATAGGPVNLCGSCAMMIDTRVVRPSIVLAPGLEEVALAVWAQEHRVPMQVVPHTADWITSILPSPRKRTWRTVWERTVADKHAARDAVLAQHAGPWEVFA